MRSVVVFVATVSVVVGGCSFSFGTSDTLDSESAAELVNDEFTEALGLGELDTECDVPDDLEEGDEISCTSSTGDGEVIQWQGAASSSSEFDIETINLLNVDAVAELELDVVATLLDEGFAVADDDLDCGKTARVLDEQGAFVCAITDQRGVSAMAMLNRSASRSLIVMVMS
ncbi:MAG: DUF4333 domain-containing protein [Actinomycetota bacterium]